MLGIAIYPLTCYPRRPNLQLSLLSAVSRKKEISIILSGYRVIKLQSWSLDFSFTKKKSVRGSSWMDGGKDRDQEAARNVPGPFIGGFIWSLFCSTSIMVYLCPEDCTIVIMVLFVL